MNQPQPTPKSKSYLKWLLIVLAVVIVGSGLYYYFGIYKGSKTTVTTSPTPTKSTAITPSAGAGTTTSPASTTGGQTNQGQTSPSKETNKFEGYITDGDDKGDQYCNYNTSFNYPNDYPAPSIDAGTLIVQKDSSSRVQIQPTSDKEGASCPGNISSPEAYYNMWHYGEILEGPTYSEANGNSIVQWTQKSDSGTPSHPQLAKAYLKVAFVKNGTKYVRISTGYLVSNSEGWMSSRETQFDSAFSTIVNSFKFE